MEDVNVVSAVLLDHVDDVGSETRENRGDDDGDQHPNDDPENRERTAELVPTDAVERHHERLARKHFRKLVFHTAYH